MLMYGCLYFKSINSIKKKQGPCWSVKKYLPSRSISKLFRIASQQGYSSAKLDNWEFWWWWWWLMEKCEKLNDDSWKNEDL